MILREIAILCAFLVLNGCATIRDTEGIPPVVFADEGPFTKKPGKIGILHKDLEARTAVLTNGQLFRKEMWSKIAHGSNQSFAWYEQTFRPMEFVAKECRKSDEKCRDAQIAVGAFALVAMAVGGVVGGLDAEYSETLEEDFKEALVRQVQGVNDQLQKSILPSASALIFEQAREHDGSGDWARQAFTALESKPLVDMASSGAHMYPGTIDTPVLSQDSDIGSFLQATITRIHFTDDDQWFSSGVELRVEAVAHVTTSNEAMGSEERQYECVSVPRPIKYWSFESYRHVREEIDRCSQQLGRQIASDLLGTSIRIGAK